MCFDLNVGSQTLSLRAEVLQLLGDSLNLSVWITSSAGNQILENPANDLVIGIGIPALEFETPDLKSSIRTAQAVCLGSLSAWKVEFFCKVLFLYFFLPLRPFFTNSVWSFEAKWSVSALRWTPARPCRETSSSSPSRFRCVTKRRPAMRRKLSEPPWHVPGWYLILHLCLSLLSRWSWSWSGRRRGWNRSRRFWGRASVKQSLSRLTPGER